ncbi:hypothetical protein GGH19_001993 [Coemansia sp. RSA 1807]|nr:hypothetical protein LPJ69_002092 [Coemansia sp. RSA 1752]KAJ2185147.1 hypothetical protein EV181_004008 [Coemansia sp. RSA 532]KAJ2202851.1 hypothetical protein IW145_004429 [Coemansia sp. RSA 521]KAJ2221468.1 hypothetical protein EV180_004647 [Coemansia sp. RSA 518]KAJ2257593.1 hypothetical protein GGH98_000732 [Coemansia sp. RSA 454]KAJ2406992.1 hypothetical protein J3F80_003144 [Coemansia sp. RSA 2526]KAJ2576668.1 hypothetical protein GGH19_001993 [Coemansia sp. RSA 1807]KAJ2727211.1 
MSQEETQVGTSVIELVSVTPDGTSTPLAHGTHAQELEGVLDGAKAPRVEPNWTDLLSPYQYADSGLRSRSNSSLGRSSFSISSYGSNTSVYSIPIEDAESERSVRGKSHKQVVRELTVEVMPALLVSVAGSVGAGAVLGRIQGSQAFEREPALLVMVSVLLNLKSNIELNMSTRLSTLANLGAFTAWTDGVDALRSNMELLLLQSTLVGVVVGVIAAALGAPAGVSDVAVLLAVGVACAVVGSAAVGVLVSATVVVGHRAGIDPDNIGTPIASSFGDMSTLLIMGIVSTGLVDQIHTVWPVATVGLFAVLGAGLLRVVQANHQMSHHVTSGYLPLVYAAITSSVAGVIVERSAQRFPSMPALVPVVNGIGGNIGTVFASRISTSLHKQRGRFVASEHNLSMIILLLINVPIQVGFLALRREFDPELQINAMFLVAYTGATAVHGLSMLVVGRVACRWLWVRGYDPDDCVNPFITGTGDMLGAILLAIVFIVVF